MSAIDQPAQPVPPLPHEHGAPAVMPAFAHAVYAVLRDATIPPARRQGVALLTWAIVHYSGTLPPRTPFATARRLFAERVLLRSNKTLRRWLQGETTIEPHVLTYLQAKYDTACQGARALRCSLRGKTARSLLWER